MTRLSGIRLLHPVLLFASIVLPSLVIAQIQDVRKIHIAISTPSPLVAAFVIANAKGFYRSDGLEVEQVVMPGTLATQALIGANVEFSTLGGAGLPSILLGAPLRMLFATFYRPLFWLYSKPGIRSVGDLKGKKIGVSTIGGGPDLLLRAALVRHGLDAARDVTVLALGESRARLTALRTGLVDATVLVVPVSFLAQEAGFRELVSFIKEDLVELQGSVIAREKLLESEPVLAQKFLRGTLRGLRYLRQNRGDSVAILARFLRVSETVAAKTYDLVEPALTRDGIVDEAIQRKSLEHILARVGLKEPPPLEKVFNFSLIGKVRDELR